MAENETHHSVGDIIREEIAKTVEGKLRSIVREELKSLLESIAKTANDGSNGYEVGELQSAGMTAISNVAEHEAGLMPHAWDCTIRDRKAWSSSCSCSSASMEICPTCKETVSEGMRFHHWKYCTGE